MPAPLSLARVLAALRWLSPSFPDVSTTDTSAGKELNSIATIAARAVDRFDVMFDELWPQLATETIDRWLKIAKVNLPATASLAEKRAKVVTVFRRSNGVDLVRLAKSLAPLFDLTDAQVEFIEAMRSSIDDALTESSFVLGAASPATAQLGKPWPGVIDDTGVRVYVDVSTIAASTVTLKHPDGTTWTIPLTATTGWYENRTLFLGKAPAGLWTLSYTAAGGVLNRWKLCVSNDVDAAQIYYFYARRNPDISGTPDLLEAQRIFTLTALAHMRTYVCERNRMIVDDDKCLVDREPIGVF